MATIDTNPAKQESVFNALRDGATRAQDAAKSARSASADGEPGASASGRTVQDTVSLSSGGQKAINLSRGAELGKDIKNAPIDENFADTLKQATDDVWRIGNLFTQTVRSMLQWWK